MNMPFYQGVAGVVGSCDDRDDRTVGAGPRWWSINRRCTCESKRCKCTKSVPHYEYVAVYATRAEAQIRAEKGALCLECGG